MSISINQWCVNIGVSYLWPCKQKVTVMFLDFENDWYYVVLFLLFVMLLTLKDGDVDINLGPKKKVWKIFFVVSGTLIAY